MKDRKNAGGFQEDPWAENPVSYIDA